MLLVFDIDGTRTHDEIARAIAMPTRDWRLGEISRTVLPGVRKLLDGLARRGRPTGRALGLGGLVARQVCANDEEDRHRDERDPRQQVGADTGYEAGRRAADLVPGGRHRFFESSWRGRRSVTAWEP
jgi:hypothetical protein